MQVRPKSSCGGMSSEEWATLLGRLDSGGEANVFDAIYGGPQVTLETPADVASACVAEGGGNSNRNDCPWAPDALPLGLASFDMGDFCGEGLSEESLSSVSGGDDMSHMDFRDFVSATGVGVGHHRRGGMMMGGDGFGLDDDNNHHHHHHNSLGI